MPCVKYEIGLKLDFDLWGRKKLLKITVFTPTYNRENIILNLYHSLQKQSFHDFEWLVIDDGSSDKTEELFAQIVNESNLFPIRYYKFPNCGKQKEINRALDLAVGELFFTVDSDDLLTPDALEKIEQWSVDLPKTGKFCGFAGSDGDLQGNSTNPLFDLPYIDATFFDRYEESDKFIGYDRPWVFFTDIHRMYRYPEFENEKFITEAVVWNRMAADGYKIRCYNDVIYLWEHQETGLTNKIHEILIENPNGYGLWISEMMDQLNYNWLKRFIGFYSFYCDMKERATVSQIAQYVGTSKFIILIASIMYKLKRR